MSFTWLAPGALLLTALIAAPILAHLARQKPNHRLAFGAMMLMQRLEKRLRRKRRLKDLWLMAVRALAVLLLALAVARPQLSWPGEPPEVGGVGAVILIMDDSMSMSQVVDGAPLWDRARDQAISLVRSLPPGVEIGLIRIGGGAERITAAPVSEHGQILSALEAMQPGYGATALGAGLREARRMLAGAPGEVVVFTDEAGPGVIAAATPELALLLQGGSAVIPRSVAVDEPRNVVVSQAIYGDGLEGGAITVEVMNYGLAAVEVPCTVALPDGSEINAFVEVPAEGVAAERFTVPPEVPGGVASARVHDDALERDDVRYFHLPRVGADRVMVVDGDPGNTPVKSEVYFLERALSPWGSNQGVLPDVTAPAGVSRLDPDRHKVVFLANVADPATMAPALTDFVRSGGAVVISMGASVSPDRYNGPLRDLLPSPLRKARNLVSLGAEDGVPLMYPDISLPLFHPFGQGGRAAFRKITARRAMTLEPYSDTDEVQTLLEYEGGVPAMVERKVGRGRVVLWTSTIDADWTGAPLQAAFVPMIQRLVNYLGGVSGGGAVRFEALVGEQTVVPLPDLNQEPDVIGPDGETVSADVQRGEGIVVRFTPDLPGAYTLSLDGGHPLAWVAVNTAPEESDVRVNDRLARVEAEIDPERFLKRADLGLPALALGMALVLLQGLIALRRRIQ